MTDITIEGYTFESSWLMKLRAKLIRLYHTEVRAYEAFFRYIKEPVYGLPEGAKRLLVGLEILDEDGKLSFDTRVAFHLMSIHSGQGLSPDMHLGWLPPGERPPCEHGPWHWAGLWDGKDGEGKPTGGPLAFCEHCGDHRKFVWSEWKALLPEQRTGLPGS